MNSFLLIGLSIFCLILLYFLYYLKKKNIDLTSKLSSETTNNAKTDFNYLSETSPIYNNSNDIIGIIEVNNNEDLIINFINQAGLNFIKSFTSKPSFDNSPKTLVYDFLKNVLSLPDHLLKEQLDHLNKAVQSKQIITYQSSFVLKNNTTNHYDVTLTPDLDKNSGKCKHILLVCHNINKHIKFQRDLIKKEKSLSSIYNSSHDFIGLVRLDQNGEYLLESINQPSINFLIHKKLITGANDLKNLPLDYLLKKILKTSDNFNKLQYQMLDNVFSLHETVMYENTIRLKEKSIYMELEMTISPILNSKKKCTQALFTARDITTRKKIKTELLASEAHAKTLFEYSPIIIWDEDFSEVKKQIDRLKNEGVSDFDIYFDQHPEAIEELSSLIKVKDINKKSVDFYAMGNKEKHINEIPFYLIDESWEVLRKEFIALANGETTFESEIPIKKLDGSIVYLIINLSIPPIYLDSWESIIVSFIDVSERKAAELLLERSKQEIKTQLERNQLIIENTLNGYILLNLDGNIVDTNASYAKLIGYSKSELLTMNLSQLAVTRTPAEIKETIAKVKENKSARFETIHQKKDGSFLTFDANLSFMQYENSPMIAAFLGDITDKKRTQEELEYRFNFESLLAKISTQFINLNIDETGQGIENALKQLTEFTNFDRSTISLFSKVNDTCSIHYEWAKPNSDTLFSSFQNVPISNLPWLFKKLKNNESVIILSQTDLPPEAENLQNALKQLNLHSIIQVPIVWQGEVIGFISFSSSEEKSPLPLNMELLFRFAGEMIINVLQRKNTAEAIKESEKRANELLISKILEAEDRERKRISKELHDSLGQNLTTASLNLNHLTESIATHNKEEQLKFKHGLKFLNLAIDESRNIAHNLMPQTIIDFGYAETVESLTEDLSKSSNTNFVFYTNLQKRLSPDQELSLFRITQEAINNILKHAQASKVTIQLMKYKDAILLTIEDNGIGFDLQMVNGNSFGIDSIKNRVSALSGQVDIDSQPQQGTSITVKIEV